MNIYEAIGIFSVTLFTGLGVSILAKFAYDGARVNLPSLFDSPTTQQHHTDKNEE